MAIFALRATQPSMSDNLSAKKDYDDKQMPVLDLVFLSQQTMGNEALEREVLEMFVGQSAQIIAHHRDNTGISFGQEGRKTGIRFAAERTRATPA